MRYRISSAGDATSAGVTLREAYILALAAAVALGVARFSYGLLLPAMKTAMDWTYATAGAMNTANAAGYLAGALLAPKLFMRCDPRTLMLAGGCACVPLLLTHAFTASTNLLYALRFLLGISSALMFICGAILAAHLAGRARSPGFVLGVYYGGAGLGIVLSTLAVPWLAWQESWIALSTISAIATILLSLGVARSSDLHAARDTVSLPYWKRLPFGIIAYGLFGLGYIGYMTFSVSMLRGLGVSESTVLHFFALVGFGMMGSSWLWAGALRSFRGGGTMSILLAIASAANLLLALSFHPAAVIASALMFGSVNISVVAAATALVRHNLPAAAWPRAIAAFTVVFASGQIIGPVVVGTLADMFSLRLSFFASAALLLVGAGAAALQQPLLRDDMLGQRSLK